MNGDSRKVQIAKAQTYFAVQTRKQEILQESLRHQERVELRKKSKESYKSYNQTIVKEARVRQGQIGIITSAGDKALFGKKTKQLKKDNQIPDNEPLEDYTHSLNTTARMFGRELTKEKIQQDGVIGLAKTISTHSRNNKQVRKLMVEEGILPEKLPMQQDIKKKTKKLNTSYSQANLITSSE